MFYRLVGTLAEVRELGPRYHQTEQSLRHSSFNYPTKSRDHYYAIIPFTRIKALRQVRKITERENPRKKKLEPRKIAEKLQKFNPVLGWYL